MKKGVSFPVTVALMALVSSLASASDPSPLQDTCVAIDEPKDAVFVNGKFCKDPKLTRLRISSSQAWISRKHIKSSSLKCHYRKC
ncbi:Germin-like protein subfamily 1 member 17 [Vitis vinifera]|uniref:Germin-like protein subfamily 1 member 17 n=1 Tax=Vitis vinifera TaxID=29760 RepID=A0A438KCS8_VITVI|nr:Germin-like protein subfamily 1 member 17 [Vitis vinifera]